LAIDPEPIDMVELTVVLPEPVTTKFLLVAEIAPATLTSPTPVFLNVVAPESEIEVSASPIDEAAPIVTTPVRVIPDAAVAVTPPENVCPELPPSVKAPVLLNTTALVILPEAPDKVKL
jgi:hypothetical protein